MKKISLLLFLLLFCLTLSSCTPEELAEFFDSFTIEVYEPDSDNHDLTDNKLVKSYKMYHGQEKEFISDCFILKDDGNYYFNLESNDYLSFEEGRYGLTFTKGYFEGYNDNQEVDLTYAMPLVNGVEAHKVIGKTLVEGTLVYTIVIDGFRF